MPRGISLHIGLNRVNPNHYQDAQGKPFIGRAGQLLTKIIEAMKLTRDEIYISNVVKCRPPSNRTPLQNESETCKSLILFKEIEIIKPLILANQNSIHQGKFLSFVFFNSFHIIFFFLRILRVISDSVWGRTG